MGARPDSDGVSCLTFPVNVGNTPVEVLESEVPILVKKRALWRDSAGPGEYRGGFGQEFEVEVLGDDIGPLDDVLVSFRGGRFIHPVPGVRGGGGAPNGELYVNGERQEPGVQRTLGPGDSFLCRAPGGGGFGDPAKRPEAAIQQDLRADLVSEKYVATHYGEATRADAGDD